LWYFQKLIWRECWNIKCSWRQWQGHRTRSQKI